MHSTNPRVDFFFSKDGKWQMAFTQLRKIVLDCGLTEDLKWGHPCYTLESTNIVLLHGFKEYCALLFFKGALLKDEKSILIQQTPNVQSARQIRFTSVADITRQKATIKAYIYEAIEVEKAGLKVELKKSTDFAVAEEFKAVLDKKPSLKKAFEALTPGRQRAYLLHFSQPKLSSTRSARVQKSIPSIMEGKGLND